LLFRPRSDPLGPILRLGSARSGIADHATAPPGNRVRQTFHVPKKGVVDGFLGSCLRSSFTKGQHAKARGPIERKPLASGPSLRERIGLSKELQAHDTDLWGSDGWLMGSAFDRHSRAVRRKRRPAPSAETPPSFQHRATATPSLHSVKPTCHGYGSTRRKFITECGVQLSDCLCEEPRARTVTRG
jgi:hypothetical protein